MKIITGSILFFICFTTSVHAQDWVTDLTTAKQQAQNKGYNIVLVFAGSDWCAPCIKLEKEIWDTQEFQALAKNHFIMVKADFPRKKQNKLSKEQTESNNMLAERYNQSGNFPLVVLLNDQGKILGKTGYKKATPQSYFKHLTSFEN